MRRDRPDLQRDAWTGKPGSRTSPGFAGVVLASAYKRYSGEVRRDCTSRAPRSVSCGAVTFAAALLVAMPARAANPHVVIRVYDLATADAAGREAALRAASQAMTSAGIGVDWRDCSRGGAAHPCRTVRGAGHLVVRIMPTGAQGDDATSPLGFAPIDLSGRATVMATVYYDAVQRVASRTGLDVPALLGRAIAHEVGHLLLRAPGHGPSGLMRPLWTDTELAQNRPADWAFSDEESRQLRAAAQEPEPSAGTSGDTSFIEQAGR
jgi:hypothetical protein